MEKGISYGPDMVAAKLAARKTQTRRLPDTGLIINQEPGRYKFHCLDSTNLGTREKPVALFSDLRPEGSPWLEPIPSPYGGIGDWLYTKEAYYTLSEYDGLSPKELPAGAPIHYEADGPKPAGYGKYRHARFMPNALARFWDEITDLRFERLQDISEKDAIAEGVAIGHGPNGSEGYKHYTDTAEYFTAAYPSFQTLWGSISGYANWNLNPWVWVITYKELSRTGRPSDEPAASPAPPVMVASPGGAPEPTAAEASGLAITPELQELLDKYPGQDAVALAAYEIGMGDLREVLRDFGQPRQPGQAQGGIAARCINDMPGPLVRILNVAVAARLLKLWLPFGLQKEYFLADEMRGLRFLEQHLDTFNSNLTTALASRQLFTPIQGGNDLAATRDYVEAMGDLLSLALDELNANADPRQPLAAMKMYNEHNMVAAVSAEAEEGLACA